jgi:4-diphosphocytidyl-2-C-methyl-D-erythritol kinase
LRITAKRDDGYHDIETIFYPLNFYEALEFVVSDEHLDSDILTVTGINTGSDSDNNIVIKTLKLLRKNYSFPFLKIHLHKIIPVGAGLGGGSSDSAFLLKAINRCFSLGINVEKLKAIALELGSDSPFFIDCNPASASGRGEKLEPLPDILTGYYLLLLNPGVGINTREAYQNCRPLSSSTRLNEMIMRPISEWKELIINDFEDYAFKKQPLIGEIKLELYKSGAIFSLMSGSGSSVYGIFPRKPILPVKLNKFVIYEGML